MPKPRITASIFALILMSCPQAIAKEETTVRGFLTWERAKQDTFLTVSIFTAGIIATQIRPGFADCIGNWYSQTEEGKLKRHTQILGIMKGFPDTVPTGVVVAVLQKQCGSFGGS